MPEAILEIAGIERRFAGGRTLFGTKRAELHAVQDVSLSLARGETLGIVGESGCGKSTLARMIVGLDRPTAGTIRICRDAGLASSRSDKRKRARTVQLVFQDPVASLNPRKTIRAIVGAPLRHLGRLGRQAREDRLVSLMDAVGLSRDFLNRYPHEVSGGQAQRIVIARALAANPQLIVLDEPVSALDVSVQAQVLNLLDDLKGQFDLTYIFISHDLSVVRNICDRVAVMYFGHIVETGTANEVFASPRHPYTHLLLRSAPVPGRKLQVQNDAETELPDPYHPPPGCPFHARCPRRSALCLTSRPKLDGDKDRADHLFACHHPHPTQEQT